MKELIAKKAQLMNGYLNLNNEVNENSFHVCIFSMNRILKEVEQLDKMIGDQNETIIW